MTRIIFFTLFYLWVFPASSFGQELAVDHFWIHVEKGAPESTVLVNAGFQMERKSGVVQTEKDSGIFQHRGQGTASKIVRFKNMYLELIWIEDRELLQKVAPEHGYTLLNRSVSSPIGIGLRHMDLQLVSLPFESSSHWVEWMRPLDSLATARRDDDTITDPAIFVIPSYLRWDLRTVADPDLLHAAVHPLGVSEVTHIRVHGPGLPSDSDAVRFLTRAGLVEFVSAEIHFLELEFDNRREKQLDLRPKLPLVIYH